VLEQVELALEGKKPELSGQIDWIFPAGCADIQR
jgi:hypothetical protein